MNEYEQWLYDAVITEKMGSVWKCPEYKKLSQEQGELQRELEDQITGEQKRLLRRQGELTIQMTNIEMEMLFQETLALARSLFQSRNV